jgi:hypothetical protein
MNRALSISIVINLLLLVIAGFLLMRCLPSRAASTVNTQQDEQFTVPRGPEGGPFRLAVIVCQLNDDPHSVATRVLERRQTGGAQFDVDIYVAEDESITRIIGFLKDLSSAGVVDGVRVIVSTSDGPVTLEGFNSSPLSAFKDIQEYRDVMNKETERDASPNH